MRIYFNKFFKSKYNEKNIKSFYNILNRGFNTLLFSKKYRFKNVYINNDEFF